MIDRRMNSGYESAIAWDGWSIEPVGQTTEACIAALQRTPRHPELRHPEVEEMYNALSFMLWKYRVAANVHLTLDWEVMGVAQSLVTERLGKYLNELQKWLKGGAQTYRRRGNGPRPHVELHYVWVHETDSNRGLHSHILMHIPPELFESFREWTHTCISRHLGRPAPAAAVFPKRGYHKTRDGQVNQQWIWFKYLSKQLNPGDAVRLPSKTIFSRDLFRPFRRRPTVEIIPMRMSGVSRSIGRTQRVSEGFVSYFQQIKFDWLYDGHELVDSDPFQRSLCLGPSAFVLPNGYAKRPARRSNSR